jgi:NAD(P)H-hydrate epimerase
VLDADGLTAFAGHADKLAAHDGPLVLTPHLGELRRLLGDESFVPTDPVETVRALAVRWGAVVVLKGMPSVVGTPDGRVLIGPPPETALATAGAGDVLAGTIAGLLAQGLAPDLAALGALHLGSAAVRMAAARAGGPAGLVASDFVAALPAARAALHA